MTTKPTITEAEAERIQDRRVWERLRTDAAYNNAANADEQMEAEDEIAEQVWREIQDAYNIADRAEGAA